MQVKATIRKNRSGERGVQMNIGFYMCIVMAPIFAVTALVFALLKGKAAILLGGFNSLPKKERETYDQEQMARDNRNSFILWTIILLIGAVASYFLSTWCGVLALIIWLILFFKDVHLDARKAFEKYKITE